MDVSPVSKALAVRPSILLSFFISTSLAASLSPHKNHQLPFLSLLFPFWHGFLPVPSLDKDHSMLRGNLPQIACQRCTENLSFSEHRFLWTRDPKCTPFKCYTATHPNKRQGHIAIVLNTSTPLATEARCFSGPYPPILSIKISAQWIHLILPSSRSIPTHKAVVYTL